MGGSVVKAVSGVGKAVGLVKKPKKPKNSGKLREMVTGRVKNVASSTGEYVKEKTKEQRRIEGDQLAGGKRVQASGRQDMFDEANRRRKMKVKRASIG